MTLPRPEEVFHTPRRFACNAWTWLNTTTGETRPMRCNRWLCPTCAPTKRELWTNLLYSARPQRLVTITRIPLEPWRAWLNLNHLRRDIRKAVRGWQDFCVLEPHARGGLHFDALQSGSSIPQAHLSALCARNGLGRVCWIAAVKDIAAVRAYVTKHTIKPGPQLRPIPAGFRRIRYTRHFFPKPVADLLAEMRPPKDPNAHWILVKGSIP